MSDSAFAFSTFTSQVHRTRKNISCARARTFATFRSRRSEFELDFESRFRISIGHQSMPTVCAPITCVVTWDKSEKSEHSSFSSEKKMGRTIAGKSTDADESREAVLRYLRDRGCGDRWDRSTSHRKQKPKTKTEELRLTVTVTPKHTVEVRASLHSNLGTSGNLRTTRPPGRSRRGMFDRAISAEARSADGRDLSVACAPSEFSTVGYPISKGSPRADPGNELDPGAITGTHRFTGSCDRDLAVRRKDAFVSLRVYTEVGRARAPVALHRVAQ